jgi:FixJ family two-component response regulator
MKQEESVVYVVDDDPSLWGAIDSLLRSRGWRVQTFVSARDFLDSKPDAKRHGCLIIDVGLPGLSGLDLQSELIKSKIQFPVIFITGHADVPTSVRAMKAGAVEFLTKPSDDTELLEAIWQAIEHDSATHDAQTDRKEELADVARI